MASNATQPSSSKAAPVGGAALQHGTRRSQVRLSSILAASEQFLASAGFDRAPWLAVAFAAGIGAWFGLPAATYWAALIAGCVALSLAGLAAFRAEGAHPYLRQALIIVPLVVAAGCATIWTKSALVGQPAIERPVIGWIEGKVLVREEQPARARVRLTLATRLPVFARPVKVRVNLPQARDRPALTQGATVRLKARLMPPAPPMLPGGYDFARSAWFAGLAATGTVLSDVELRQAASGEQGLKGLQQRLSHHVRGQIDGSSGTIAATLASGDRGAIAETDAEAMRDSGLAHLLSISGLHVSALIGVAFLLALRLLALSPWLALRVPLPVLAAGVGAAAGIFYTLLTGAEVPTVRSCVGALLVLAALALGREALSFRMLAIAAFLVLLLWPEALVGPSFQMSFSSVIAIVALSQSEPVRRFLAPRPESWAKRALRHFGLLLLTGVVIELVLMPIALYHFSRSGAYGALANVVAIPLTTLVIMPLIALTLLLDSFAAGAPVWWLAEKALDALIALAHFVAAQPGAVTHFPSMGTGSFLLFVAGGLWLALWHHRLRLLGLIPAAIGALHLATLAPPDILVSSDGRHVGLTEPHSQALLVLRESRSDFVRDNLIEGAGMNGAARPLAQWPGAQCNEDFCKARLQRGDRAWDLLIARGRDYAPERSLAAACARSDIVIADRGLPRSCKPRWLKVDRRLLARTGGLTIDLDDEDLRTVAQGQGAHGWWRPAPSGFRLAPSGFRAAPTANQPAASSKTTPDLAIRKP
jgi:competence protein ComEC